MVRGKNFSKMVNLHKVLVRYNESITENPQEELILKEANSILQESFNSDLRILEKSGLSGNLIEAKNIEKERRILTKFNEIYDIKAIRKIAINYHLRFLPSELYVGTIDPQLPSIINKFCNKSDVIPEPDDFYILAPKQSFKLRVRPKDPLMFYRVTEDKYAFIHKWGHDLSIWRYLSSLPLRSGNWLYALTISVCITTILSFFIGLKFDLDHISIKDIFNAYWYYCIRSLPISIVLTILSNTITFSSDVWDVEFKD